MAFRVLFFAVLASGLLFLATTGLTYAAEENDSQMVTVLKYAYENNPSLRAARAELKSVQELMPQALGGWKPTIEATGNVSSVKIDGSNFGGEGTTSKEVDVGFNQPLYRGWRTLAATDKAQARIEAQRALLNAAEQDLLLTVATAYMDVLRDQALLKLAANNETVLRQELEATQDRFDVGELTRTDVSQAQARLAEAEAGRIRAAGNLESSRAIYEQVVGLKPGNLISPVIDFAIPVSLEEAVSYAENNNPVVIASRYTHESAEEDVNEIFGELLPELGLFGSWNRQWDPQPGLLKESTTGTIGVSASIPLYQAGTVRSRVRQAKHTANQRYLEILESRRDIRQQVISNWESLQAARAEILSRKAQVEAASIAQEGVKAENELGARSVLEVLDAEQEFLDARVAYVSAQRNEVVAEFALAATLGILTPETFGGSDFSKEFEEHLETVKWKILGIDVDRAQETP